MFTGIIEQLTTVVACDRQAGNLVFTFESPLADELKVDQSVSHNGVCLTVTKVTPQLNQYQVVAVDETLTKSNLGHLKPGDIVNLERAMVWGARLDGHLVQGHVDTVGKCTGRKESDGSWIFSFQFDPNNGQHLVVEKGSICINGVSLTCFNTTANAFDVAIIPFTFEHTNFQKLEENQSVNLEFDIVGKYIQRMMKSRQD